jgi:hypothetical protein
MELGDVRIRQLTARAWLPLILCGSLAGAMVARPIIGFVAGRGSFQLDRAAVAGNGTVYDGSSIESGGTAPNIRLQDGTHLRLASQSRGRVYRDRFVLESGAGWFESGPAYRIETALVRVAAAEPKAAAWISQGAEGGVRVAALRGSVRVSNATGLLVARVAPGRLLELSPQQSGAMPSTLTGTLTRQDGHYLLRDEATGVTVEVRGANLESQVGQRVDVTGKLVPGARPASGADHVFEAATVKRSAAAAAAMSAATKASIAGLAVAGGAIGATLAITGDEEEIPTVSR